MFFRDGKPFFHVYVMLVNERVYPTRSAEADPLWWRIDRLPWDEMWPDDHLWLPCLLQRQRFWVWCDFDASDESSKCWPIREAHLCLGAWVSKGGFPEDGRLALRRHGTARVEKERSS